jgi:O-antigen/teichoic acid export membrane protein
MTLNLGKIGGNALSLLTSDVMNRATSFVLYAMVGRHLGAHEFGQLSLALTLFYIFQVFAAAGMKTLIIRQVTKDPSQTKLYVINGCAIVIFTSIVSISALVVFVRLMRYPADTTLVILLLALGLLPFALSVICEGVFQAWERMRYIASVNVPINIAKIVGAYFLLSTHHGLYAVVTILLVSFTAVAILEIGIILSRFPSQPASFDLHFSLATIRTAFTFLGIDGTIALMSSLNVLFLSKMTSEVQVGLYCAATQVMVPVLLVYQNIAQSVFPLMCRRVEPGFQGLKYIAEQVIEVLLVLALPAVAGLFFLGDWVLGLFYKNPVFLQAFPALRIMAWVMISQVFTSVFGQVLVASHREKVTLRIVVIDTLLNLILGWPLIHLYGLRGAAIALLLMRIVDCLQHLIPVSRLFSGISAVKIAWKPIIAGACMTAYLVLPSTQAVILRGVSATAIYSAALIVLAIWASGGVRQFRDKYLSLRTE